MMAIILQCIKVASSCFSFDFLGRFDETSENPPYNQMPLAWSSMILNESLMQPVFDIAFSLSSEEHQIYVIELANK